MRKKLAVSPPEPDEISLFHAAVADAKPLKPDNRVRHKKPAPSPLARQHLADERDALRESMQGAIGLQDRLEGGDEPNYLRPGLALGVIKDLRRGRWVVQDEVDLHGLTRDEARPLLAAFLTEAMRDGIRCVRIIHGKGLGSPGRQAVLRQLVRGWLMQKEEILAYCQARPQDGGEGALIALLRSATKNRPTS